MVLVLFALGCDCEGPLPEVDAGDAGEADASPELDAFMVVDAGRPDTGTDAGEMDAAMGPDCDDVTCTLGQRCDLTSGEPTCVDNTCDDLMCTATERCTPHAMGGNTCVSIACDSDVECDPSEYCDGTICVTDVCTPGVSRCDADAVLVCDSNGGGESSLATCGSESYFATGCVDEASGGACTCEGDWDCPAFQVCEVGRCIGSGTAPSCTLPPVPFAEALPAIEIEWGGVSRSDDDARDGTGTGTLAPWPNFSHVLNTPVVANLDDDNGDGLVNELDFPEIIFVGHQGSNAWTNGVLRAIHGGGPNRGADFFARCGDLLWRSSDPISDTCGSSTPDSDSGAPVAVGDLDGDGFPEIVTPIEGNRFRILSGDGSERYTLPTARSWASADDGETLAIADLNFDGFAEIIAGRTVYMMGLDASGEFELVRRLEGAGSPGNNAFGFMACPADLRPDLPGQEVVAGGTLYRIPDDLPACISPPCTDVALEVVWSAAGVDGYCAVADVWGADPDTPPGPANPPDGVPEVILIEDGELVLLAAADGSEIERRSLGGGDDGGAPNVDDFDGDGYMEIASALQNFYVVVDLQDSTGAAGACPSWPAVIARATESDGSHNTNPARTPGGACTMDSECDAAAACNVTLGQCVCLHNGWRRSSDDDSSRATSSSVFDFNGDGAAEVLYNDECDFRVFDGTSGEVLFSEVSRSRTGIENPVVADVDNDGNAEAISVSNTAIGDRCDEDTTPIGPNGIRVWGDPSDAWVSARRVWNQQSYHVVNVTEGGGVPDRAPESWGSFNGRTYNTYRSQPRSFGVAPDLVVEALAVSSPDVGCGMLSDQLAITFQIRNAGDVRVGPGVEVVFFGTFGGTEEALMDGGGGALSLTLSASLEPGRSVFLTVNYEASFSSRGVLPDSVRVEVDPTSMSAPFGAERECREENNERSVTVEAGDALADLRVELGTPVPDCDASEVDVPTTVTNDGSAPASDVVVRYYAGDPAAGGTLLHEETIPGPIAASASETITATIPSFPSNRSIVIFVEVDPDNTIEECNDGNNTASAPEPVICSTII
ncbi:MAG: FG-GAP-like repeat-containing protein [Sandaracinaceae bacterium]